MLFNNFTSKIKKFCVIVLHLYKFVTILWLVIKKMIKIKISYVEILKPIPGTFPGQSQKSWKSKENKKIGHAQGVPDVSRKNRLCQIIKSISLHHSAKKWISPMINFGENELKYCFRHFTAFSRACPRRVRIFPNKPSTPNHKVHWPPLTCKITERSYDRFARNWAKISFRTFYNIFTGMPKACQICSAWIAYAKL